MADSFEDSGWTPREQALLILDVVKRRFPITPEQRADMVAACVRLMNCDNERAAARAVEALTKMEAMNQKDEHKLLPDLSVNINADATAAIIKPHEADPNYLEYLRNRALSADSDPGDVCARGEPGKVEALPAPCVDRPLSNGCGDGPTQANHDSNAPPSRKKRTSK